MSYGDPDPVSHKTGRIAILCITLAFMGFFYFLYKVEACSSKPENCRDEFVEIRNDGYHADHKCAPGAIVEVVNAPPAPKPGIMCHCPKNGSTPVPPAPSTNAH